MPLNCPNVFEGFCFLSRSILPDYLQPYGLQPPRLLCPWDSPDKNTGVSSHSLPSPGDLPFFYAFLDLVPEFRLVHSALG